MQIRNAWQAEWMESRSCNCSKWSDLVWMRQPERALCTNPTLAEVCQQEIKIVISHLEQARFSSRCRAGLVSRNPSSIKLPSAQNIMLLEICYSLSASAARPIITKMSVNTHNYRLFGTPFYGYKTGAGAERSASTRPISTHQELSGGQPGPGDQVLNTFLNSPLVRSITDFASNPPMNAEKPSFPTDEVNLDA